MNSLKVNLNVAGHKGDDCHTAGLVKVTFTVLLMLPDENVVHFAGKLIFSFFCVCLAGSIFCSCLAGIEIAALRMSRTPSGDQHAVLFGTELSVS